MRQLFPLFLILLVASCNKSEKNKAAVDFNFQTQIGSADYTFSEYFSNGDGIKIRIEVLQFYIADVRFVDKKGKETTVADIALVKCLNGSGLMSLKVPAGDYSAIKFGIGVPDAMNQAGPAAYTEADHPLSSTQNTYWGMNSMYRFVMVDGKYDLTGDGIDEGGFSYHTGFSDCYREVEWAHEFSFDKKGTHTENVSIDLSKLFYVSGSIVDVPTESNFHGDYSQIDLAIRLSNNFASALSIQ
jgi:hypothetical protein